MKWFSFIALFYLLGCASTDTPLIRSPSSEPLPPHLEVDLKNSNVQIFPVVAAADSLWYYFYVQLKNDKNEYVDCAPSEIELKTTKQQVIPFKFERLIQGRYYLTIEKTSDFNSSQLDIFVRGKALKEQFRLQLRHPDKKHSKIVLLSNKNNRMNFQLHLADKQNRPVELLDNPEIIMEGMGTIEDLRPIKDGLWEFSLIYPDENQIMYFSVRAQGVYLQNLFRHQHVEK